MSEAPDVFDGTDAKKKSSTCANNLTLVRDPTVAQNRIFIGNLPVCTKEELESICRPYGTVLGSLVQKNFGFVQFDCEEVATKAASALNKSVFKGNTVTVRNAAVKKINTPKKASIPIAASVLTSGANAGGDTNDCEIIVVDRKNTKYAEYIEDRLKRLNMRVDVLFPNEDVALGMVLSNIAQRGSLYAILVTNQHQEHNSITVNILFGQPAEHRNMPVEDAIKLIKENFQSLPKPVPIISAVMGGTKQDRHPDSIQMLLNMLAENLPLTVLQYEKIIDYLMERKQIQVKIELGSDATVKIVPDPEIELQKKILSILERPSVAETRHKLLYSTPQDMKNDKGVLHLLSDQRVQRALDSLMDQNFLETIETMLKF